MTTDDRHIATSHSPELEVEPDPARAERMFEPPAAPATGRDPSHAATEATSSAREPGAVRTDDVTSPGQEPVAHSEPSTAPDNSRQDGISRTSQVNESPGDRSLFADDELTELRGRWEHVQAAFVDDPKDCVQKADGLVSDVVERLTTGFTDARSRLEQQWARGEEASTEDLRLALKRYREFFQRLLAV